MKTNEESENIKTASNEVVNVKRFVSTSFINPDICSACGGKCCKSFPGIVYPSDFETEQEIVKAIKSGQYAIDWWEGDPGDGDDRRAYFVRPAIKGKEGVVYDPAWTGKCVFLAESGCSLVLHNRPRECRELEPKQDNVCINHNNVGKQDACLAWRKHFQLLDTI